MKLYNHNLWFFDFEVFEDKWFVSFKPYQEEIYHTFQRKEELIHFLLNHKEDIFVGYNNNNYDNLVLQAIYNNINPDLINKNLNDKTFLKKFKKSINNKLFLNLYDTMTVPSLSLKQFELNIGEAVFEIDFSNPPDDQTIIKYNKYDVKMTEKFFEINEQQNETLKYKIELIKYLGKKLTQLSWTDSSIVGYHFCNNNEPLKDGVTHFYKTPNFIKNNISKYQNVIKIIENHLFDDESKLKLNLELQIKNVNLFVKEGGIHGCNENKLWQSNQNWIIVDIDASSFYPSIMCYENNPELRFYSKNMRNWRELWNLLNKRLNTKDKNENAILKLILNKIYGIMGEQYNPLFDWKNKLNVCLTGQLMMLMVLEQLEINLTDWELIQANTDGITIFVNRDELDNLNSTIQKIKDITKIKWKIELLENARIHIKDVNNYLFVNQQTNEIKRKGNDFINQKNIWKKCQCPIINIIAEEILTQKTSIQDCWVKYFKQENIQLFSIVQHIQSRNYSDIYWGQKPLYTNNVRFFVIENTSDPQVVTKEKNGTKHKFPEVGNNHFVWNEALSSLNIINLNINKLWIIQKIQKLLKQY